MASCALVLSLAFTAAAQTATELSADERRDPREELDAEGATWLLLPGGARIRRPEGMAREPLPPELDTPVRASWSWADRARPVQLVLAVAFVPARAPEWPTFMRGMTNAMTRSGIEVTSSSVEGDAATITGRHAQFLASRRVIAVVGARGLYYIDAMVQARGSTEPWEPWLRSLRGP